MCWKRDCCTGGGGGGGPCPPRLARGGGTKQSTLRLRHDGLLRFARNDGGESLPPHAFPRSSRNKSSFCCTGRSEKENSTASVSASCVTQCQLGTTNRSRAPHSNTWSPILVRPLPSIAANTVASVAR